MNPPNTFCSHCGTRFEDTMTYPRACEACGAMTWINPRPVGVALIPVVGTDGVLLVERAIRPLGPALVGGFMETGHSWRENVVREIEEETGLIIPAAAVSLLHSPSVDTLFDTPNGNMLVFASTPPVELRDIEAAFVPNEEVSGWLIGYHGTRLVFPAHQAAMDAFLRERGGQA